MSVAAAFRGMPVARMSALRGIAPLADIPDGECGDGFSQSVIRREHPVIPMPVLPRRRDEVREPVEKLIRREFDDAVGPRTRGFLWSAGPDPVGRLMSRQHVADASDAAVCAADHREPLQCEGGQVKGKLESAIRRSVEGTSTDS